jgi:outer membrane protein assembly factor BamA
LNPIIQNYWVFFYREIIKNKLNQRLCKFIVIIISLVAFHSECTSQEAANLNNSYEIDDINIKFKTKSIFEDSDLKNLLASREGDVYDLNTFILDVERIKKFYFDNGFFDTVVDTNLVFNKADREVILNFTITENSRYEYYEIKYTGLDSIEQSVREKIFKPEDYLLRKGRFYSKDTIKLEINRILATLYNNGYATAISESPEVLKYETNVTSLKNKVNVNLILIPKLRYVFGKTKITFKNQKYNITEQDITRELTYKENQIYNKEEVVNSELNISKIAILENPRITFDKIDSINKKIDLAINAIVGYKYSLTPEIFGYYFQNVFYLGPGLAFSDKYFFKNDRVLNASARFYFHSFNDNRFELLNTITQPYLFNNRNITGNWNIGIQYRLNEQYNITQVQNNFEINYDLPTYTYINRISTNWSVENYRTILKQDVIASNEDTTITVPEFVFNYFTSILGLSLFHNTVNDIQFPYKGYYQSYELQESGLLGNIVKKLFNTISQSFFRFTDFNAGYFNLSKREDKVASVLAGKVSFGILYEYGDGIPFGGLVIRSGVPTDEKFVCGGSSSIRGWGAKQLGIVADKEYGGNFIIENSIEHRTKPFLNAKNSYLRDLGFATFIDFGNAWSEIGKFKLNEIALAAGGGIRYYTIIGAIRLEVGFKIYDPQPGPVGGSYWIFGPGCNFSDKYNIQFGIGNSF